MHHNVHFEVTNMNYDVIVVVHHKGFCDVIGMC